MIDVGHGVLILKIRRMISGELGLLRLENVAVNVFDEPGNIVLIPSEVSWINTISTIEIIFKSNVDSSKD